MTRNVESETLKKVQVLEDAFTLVGHAFFENYKSSWQYDDKEIWAEFEDFLEFDWEDGSIISLLKLSEPYICLNAKEFFHFLPKLMRLVLKSGKKDPMSGTLYETFARRTIHEVSNQSRSELSYLHIEDIAYCFGFIECMLFGAYASYGSPVLLNESKKLGKQAE